MIPRRMLGFGFALFLILVILAVIYSQFAMQRQPNPSDMSRVPESSAVMGKKETTPLPATVTPDTATADLIDEALDDNDDLTSYTEDEVADLESGE